MSKPPSNKEVSCSIFGIMGIKGNDVPESVSIYKAQGDDSTQVGYDSSLNLSIPHHLKCIVQL